MNPEQLDLATWRTQAPAKTLRDRVLASRRDQPQPHARALRWGVAGALALTVGVAVLPRTAPASPSVLFQRAEARIVRSPVHLVGVSYEPDGHTPMSRDESWIEDGFHRMTSTSPRDGKRSRDSILVRLDRSPIRSELADIVATIRASQPRESGKGRFELLHDGERLIVQNNPRRNLYDGFSISTLVEFSGSPRRTMYRELAGGPGVRRIEATEAGKYRLTLDVATRTERVVAIEFARWDADAWRRGGTYRVEYPATIPADRYDPATLRR